MRSFLIFYFLVAISSPSICQTAPIPYDRKSTHRKLLEVRGSVDQMKVTYRDTTGSKGRVELFVFDEFGRLIKDIEVSGGSDEIKDWWIDWEWADTSYLKTEYDKDSIKVLIENYVFDFSHNKLEYYSLSCKDSLSIFLTCGIDQDGDILYWPDTSVSDTVELIRWDENKDFIGVDLLVCNKFRQVIWSEERSVRSKRCYCNNDILDRCGETAIWEQVRDSLGSVILNLEISFSGDTTSYVRSNYIYDHCGNWILKEYWLTNNQIVPYTMSREISYFRKNEQEFKNEIPKIYPVVFRLDWVGM